MEYQRIIRDIELKNYKPVYFLMGEEAYFIDQITEVIEDKVLDEMSKTFCQTIVYGRDVTMEQVVSTSKGFPMMGDRQVIIVKEAQDMKEWKSRKKEDEDDEFKTLTAYLQNPTPSTILVFNFKGKSLDKRKKIYKLLDKQGVVFESEKIKDYKLAEWIDKYVAARGFKINHNASQLLAEYLGTDLSKVVNAVNKLAIILKDKGEITPQLIEQNIGISKDYNVWELQKALGQKDVLKANRIIQYFESNPKNNPIQMVLPSLYNYYAKLAMYISVPDKKNAAAELGMTSWALNDYKEAATLYNAQKVERIIGYIRDTDKKSKGVNNVSVDHGDLMKELVFKILH
jgi:DNA polymerase III subunit delta